MTDEAVVPIARVPLARSPRRLLAVPLLLIVAAATAGVLGVLALPGVLGFALIGVALLAAIGAVYLAAIVLTARLEVEVSTLHLRWFGSDRQYTLARGPVTRVILVGERAQKLRPRFGAFGWGLGPARLRGEETVQLIRLARSPAVILVPTESGRVAVAPRSEEQFLGALAAAARVQQRLDMVAARTRAIPAAQPRAPEPPPPEPVPVEPSRPLTGIERQLLEERLAAERAAALAAAEEERRAAARAAELAAAEAAALAAAAAAQRAAVPPARRPAAAPARARRAIPRPAFGRLAPERARLISLALAVVPLLAAAGVWGVAAVAGTSSASSTQAQQVSVGLALAGPGAALAALAARAWFPRLVGLVVVTAVCALVLIGRSLIG
jgi:hypothetical protein